MFRKFSIFFVVSAALCGAGFAPGGVAHAAKLDAAVCAKLARGKAYKEASSCFLRIAKSLDKPKLSPVERKLKGLYLNNAAKLMVRTAAAQKDPKLKAYYNEQAANMYKRYLREKLCTQSYRCQEISGKLYGLIKAINYAQLTVIAGPKAKGKISFEGYKYQTERSFPPNITLKLRPGKYRMIIEFSDKSTKIMNVTAGPGKTEIVTVNAPAANVVVRREPPRRIPTPPKAKTPVWAWVVLGVGIAAAVTSPVMFGLGASEASEAINRRDEYLDQAAANAAKPGGLTDATIRNSHDDVLVTHELAQTYFTVGWVLAGVGAAAVVVGIVGLATAKPEAPPAMTSLPGANKTDARRVSATFSF